MDILMYKSICQEIIQQAGIKTKDGGSAKTLPNRLKYQVDVEAETRYRQIKLTLKGQMLVALTIPIGRRYQVNLADPRSIDRMVQWLKPRLSKHPAKKKREKRIKRR